MRGRPGIGRLAAGLLIMLGPTAGLAQTAPASPPPAAAETPAPPAGRARGGDISRDEYIERAVERAKRAAEKRFDKMDANHDGILTADERRAAREERRQRRESQPQ